MAPNIHCVEILRTTQNSENWREEKIESTYEKPLSLRAPNNWNQAIKIKRTWISIAKNPKMEKFMSNQFEISFFLKPVLVLPIL